MMEFMRRQQQQQQGMAQRSQGQFGGMPQLGANSNNPFQHDPSQGLPNAQSHVNSASTNANFMQQQALRQNAMLSANPGNPMNRQLNLLLQQNQENQQVPSNPQLAFLRQMQQQQQQQHQQPHGQPQFPLQQHAQMNNPQIPGFFGGASMTANMPNNMPQTNGISRPMMPQQQVLSDGGVPAGMPGAVPGQRRPNLVEMQEKATQLRNIIQEGEARIKRLQAQQAGPMSAEVLQEISNAQKDVEQRRQLLNRIMNYVRQMQNGGVPPGMAMTPANA